MIAFDSTTRKLQAVLAGNVSTSQSPWIASWQDGDTGPVHTNFVETNNTTAVDVVPAPTTLGAGSRRLKFASLSNQDTATIKVTVQYVDTAGAGTTWIITVVSLSVGDTLMYEEGAGWISTDSTGSLKQVSNATLASQAFSMASQGSSLASSASLGLLPSVSSQASSTASLMSAVSSNASAGVQGSSLASNIHGALGNENTISSVASRTKSSFGW